MIPSAAIAAAARIAAPLSECRLLVIGAGTIAKSAALNAGSRGCREIVVANRDIERARSLAQRVGGRGTTLDALAAEVATAHVVVSATAAPGFVLTADRVAAVTHGRLLIFDPRAPARRRPGASKIARATALRRRRPLASRCGERTARRAGLEHAEAIVREQAERYERWRVHREHYVGKAPAFLVADQRTHARCPQGGDLRPGRDPAESRSPRERRRQKWPLT